MRNSIFGKFLPLIALFLLTLSTVATASAKGDKGNKVYAFGYATCLGDTMVYLSAIQVLDSAQVDAKTGFLINRADYSRQMEQAMKGRFGKPYTCAVMFGTNRSKLEKTYLSIKRHTEHDKSFRLSLLTIKDFKFSPIIFPTE